MSRPRIEPGPRPRPPENSHSNSLLIDVLPLTGDSGGCGRRRSRVPADTTAGTLCRRAADRQNHPHGESTGTNCGKNSSVVDPF
jgi:hypothetical protein